MLNKKFNKIKYLPGFLIWICVTIMIDHIDTNQSINIRTLSFFKQKTALKTQ